ncbi:hypothetical protein D3C76_1484850 [compost metagenome]
MLDDALRETLFGAESLAQTPNVYAEKENAYGHQKNGGGKPQNSPVALLIHISIGMAEEILLVQLLEGSVPLKEIQALIDIGNQFCRVLAHAVGHICRI